jgi:hypothetical protein
MTLLSCLHSIKLQADDRKLSGALQICKVSPARNRREERGERAGLEPSADNELDHQVVGAAGQTEPDAKIEFPVGREVQVERWKI